VALLHDIAAERRGIVTRLRELPDEQWQTPSLCSGWTVHHVLAHLTTPFLVSRPAMGLRFLRHRGIGPAMDAAARSLAQRSPQELLDVLERNAGSRFVPPGFGLTAPLTDAVVHGADIRWALGDPHDDWGDPERLRPVLDFLVSPMARGGFLPPSRRSGLRLRTCDQSWESGRGAEVSGPSLSLALGLLGRREALGDLSGEGVALLASRLS
jgi:uncharacterized protein (TIGR03083 family)